MFRIVSLIAVIFKTASTYNITDAYCDELYPSEFNESAARFGNRSQELNPFTILLSSHNYVKDKLIDVKVDGLLNSTVLIQVKDTRNRRVGTFVQWPKARIVYLKCGRDNKVLLFKLLFDRVTLRWRPPKFDVGTVTVMAIFIHDNDFWIVDEGPKIYYEKMKRKKRSVKCPMSSCHQCLRYSSNRELCHSSYCVYMLSYSLDADKRTMRFLLNGPPNEDYVYHSVGFNKNAENKTVSEVASVTCKQMGNYLEVMPYLPSVNFSKTKFSFIRKATIDGNQCSFDISLKILAENGYFDLETPSYFVYFWGTIDKKTKKIILPETKIKFEKFNYETSQCSAKESPYYTTVVYLTMMMTLFRLKTEWILS